MLYNEEIYADPLSDVNNSSDSKSVLKFITQKKYES